MNLTLFHGYPDRVGKRSIWCGTGVGPKSYVGGNSPTDAITGLPFQYYIDSVTDVSISSTGTHYAVAQPVTAGVRSTWNLRYFITATGAEVANAVDLSAETFVLSGFGGFY